MLCHTTIKKALDAAACLDRQTVRDAIIQLLGTPSKTSEDWRYLIKLSSSLGEGGAAIEAARRYSSSDPTSLQRRLVYCETLAEFRKEEQALAILRDLDDDDLQHPAAQYLYGLLCAQNGDFEEAQFHLRAVIAAGQGADAAYFTLGSVKRYVPGDPDLAAMIQLASNLRGRDPRRESRLGFAIGNAQWSIGEYATSFETVSEAARLQRQLRPYDPTEHERFVSEIIDCFTSEALTKLSPSKMKGSRALYVTGLPRTGTTLAERLLTNHPDVHAGGEINLWGERLFQTSTPGLDWALAREKCHSGGRVWQQLAEHYALLLWAEFPEGRHIVDKTLLQTIWLGLLLHAMPDARVVYMRRDEVATAWSCFRTLFPDTLPWTNSLQDIGRYFVAEQVLLDHWMSIYPDRIIVVSQEDLIDRPMGESERMMSHFGLRSSKALGAKAVESRVKTASLFQVRQEVGAAHATDAAPIREKVLAELERGKMASPFTQRAVASA